jgi:hypothetical protein
VEVALVRLTKLDDLDQLPALVAQLQGGPSSTGPGPRPATGTPGRAPVAAAAPVAPLATEPQKKSASNLASPPASPPVAEEAAPPLDQAAAQAAWRQTLAELGDMTGGYAARAESIAISAPNRLAVRFRKAYTQALQFCERPESRQKLEQTLSRLTGRNIRIDFSVLPDEPTASGTAVAPPPRPGVNRRQRQQEVLRHPLIRRANELFDTEILTILDAPAIEEPAAATGDAATATG